VFTVGQPRVGNKEFSEWFDTFQFNYLRVVNQLDLAPHLPPRWAGFLHVSLEVYIQNDEGDTVYCHVENNESTECANSNKVFSSLQHPYAWDILIGHSACLLEP
jgi:hypothetical protein